MASESLFDKAAKLVVESQIGSFSLIQRRLRISYDRAKDLMDKLEEAGIVGPLPPGKLRAVLIKTAEELQSLKSKRFLVRKPIPQDVMDAVWNRDMGKCVICGSQEKLEFDHIIPFSKGGSNTYRNIQILCEKCNIEKSNNIG
jgi:hypothetical protein